MMYIRDIVKKYPGQLIDVWVYDFGGPSWLGVFYVGPKTIYSIADLYEVSNKFGDIHFYGESRKPTIHHVKPHKINIKSISERFTKEEGIAWVINQLKESLDKREFSYYPLDIIEAEEGSWSSDIQLEILRLNRELDKTIRSINDKITSLNFKIFTKYHEEIEEFESFHNYIRESLHGTLVIDNIINKLSEFVKILYNKYTEEEVLDTMIILSKYIGKLKEIGIKLNALGVD